ncbi:hypothetical protein GF322_01390, partial [Candidatus Dependentiae bacterium]|nr:hypothetical protein [Candidatus Dependentiae bacterium]
KTCNETVSNTEEMQTESNSLSEDQPFNCTTIQSEKMPDNDSGFDSSDNEDDFERNDVKYSSDRDQEESLKVMILYVELLSYIKLLSESLIKGFEQGENQNSNDLGDFFDSHKDMVKKAKELKFKSNSIEVDKQIQTSFELLQSGFENLTKFPYKNICLQLCKIQELETINNKMMESVNKLFEAGENLEILKLVKILSEKMSDLIQKIKPKKNIQNLFKSAEDLSYELKMGKKSNFNDFFKFLNSEDLRFFVNSCSGHNMNKTQNSIRDKDQDYQMAIDGCKDLENVDLSERDLSNFDLRRSNLKGANLSRCNLKNTKLGGANLTNANLSEANLCYTNLSHANITNTNFSQATFNFTNLDGAIFEDNGLDFFMRRPNFIGTIFIQTRLSNLKLNNIDFSESKFKEVIFVKCNLNFVKMDKIQAGGLTFEDCSLLNVTFRDAFLYGFLIKNTKEKLYGPLDFENADIVSSEFRGAAVGFECNGVWEEFIMNNLARPFAEWVTEGCIGMGSVILACSFNGARLKNMKFSFIQFIDFQISTTASLNRVEFKNVLFISPTDKKDKKEYHKKLANKLKKRGAVVNGKYAPTHEDDWKGQFVVNENLLPFFLKGYVSNLGAKFVPSLKICPIQ